MANKLYTDTQAARSVLASLRYLSTIPRTVLTDFANDFVPGRGAAINVKMPVSAGEAKTYTKTNRESRDAIEFNDILQEFVTVNMDNQVYNAVRLPDDWATFSLEDLQRQVLIPQAESVVDALAAPLITELEAVKSVKADLKTEVVTSNADALAFAPDGSNAAQTIISLRQVLNARKVPMQNRFLAVGPGVEAALLNVKELQRVNESGSDGVLREATIGRLFGFTIVADPMLAPDKAVAYHRDAFAFVTRPSRVPEGAAHGTTVAQDGFALRHIMQYNPNQIEDQSVVDCFVAAKTLDAKRAVAAGLKAAVVGG